MPAFLNTTVDQTINFFLFDEVLPFVGRSRCYAVYYCTTERDDPCTIAHHDGGVQSGAEGQPMTVV